MTNGALISDQEFLQFKNWIYQNAGITLSMEKKALVTCRLAKRIQHYRFDSYGQYFKLLVSGKHPQEIQTAVDLLTTNETYFFREPKHFRFLAERVLNSPARGRPFRVWSAASSYGQEAYSTAMLLADKLGAQPWEILATDISSLVLDKARTGHNPIEQAQHIPKEYLERFCLKGFGAQEGTFLIDGSLRNRVRFQPINLTAPLPSLGEFDVVFLRNVMIYFNQETKAGVIGRIARLIRPGGYLLIGHSESLSGIPHQLETVAPAIYRVP